MMTPSGAGSRTRRRSGALLVTAAVVASVLAGCAATSAHHAPAHHAPAQHAADGSYGKLPSWLPSDDVQANSMLTADVAHPAVTSEGDEVEVHLAGGIVRVEVTGPEVPGEGLPVQPEDTTCTWTVTMSHASAPVRVSAADFDALDHLGTIYRVAPVSGRPRIPSTVRPGETVRFELRAAMPTGEGLIRYSGGTRSVLANWDFVVEND